MIEDIKTMLGDAARNYSDALITLTYRQTLLEIEDYCKRDADAVMESIAQRITVIKLNRLNTEGTASQSYSGVSESYIDGYPSDIQQILRAKRRIIAL